jgi:hypothetical protein
VTASGLPSGLLVYAAGERQPTTHDIPFAGKWLHVRSLELSGDLDALRDEIRDLAAVVRNLETAATAA